jgi:HPt (histidine-containing phosphotransfer) domain-containing protein
MDGYALAGNIRKEEQQRGLPRTPIIALTASALKGEAERCLAAGMDDYLAKPVAIATLAAMLQRWLPHTASAQADADAAGNGDVNASAALASDGFPQLEEAPPLLDYNALNDLSGGDEAETSAVLRDFLDATAQDLAQLAQAREGGDIPAIAHQAHKIKGAARLVGAIELAHAAAELEAAGHAGEWAGILPLVAHVDTAAERLKLFVAQRYSA